jgi:hypothetical protein
MKETEDVEELRVIAKRLSMVSRGYVLASARAAEFGEQAIKRQYGIPDREPETTRPQGAA